MNIMWLAIHFAFYRPWVVVVVVVVLFCLFRFVVVVVIVVIIIIIIIIMRVIKSRRMRWAENVARMEEGRSVHRVLVGKPDGKRPLGRPRRRWEDNIKIWIFRKWDGFVGTGRSWLRIGTVGARL